MPCFFGCLALLAPRLTLLFLALFTDFVSHAYDKLIWPVLGFFFLPLTTLAYAAAINWNGEVTGGYFAMVLVAALIDLGLFGGAKWRPRFVTRRVYFRNGRPAPANEHDYQETPGSGARPNDRVYDSHLEGSRIEHDINGDENDN